MKELVIFIFMVALGFINANLISNLEKRKNKIM